MLLRENGHGIFHIVQPASAASDSGVMWVPQPWPISSFMANQLMTSRKKQVPLVKHPRPWRDGSHGTFNNSSSCGKDCAQGSVGSQAMAWGHEIEIQVGQGRRATKTNVFHSCSTVVPLKFDFEISPPEIFRDFAERNIAEGM